jgi:4-aminobutyrate aminotransferase-like enzyme
MTPEGKVKASVKYAMKKLGVWAYMPVQNGMGRVGIPDFICCVPTEITPDMVGKTIGVFMGVETKAPGKIKHTTPNQRSVLRQIHEAGAVAVVADASDTVTEAIGKLRALGETEYRVPV